MNYEATKAALQKVGAHLRLGPGLSGVTRHAALDAYAEVWAEMVETEFPAPQGERERALREVLANLLAVACPTTAEGHTGFVDRLGMQFYRETGIWPPFKSAPMEMRHEPTDEDRKAWGAWLERNRFEAADAAAAALAASSPHYAEKGDAT